MAIPEPAADRAAMARAASQVDSAVSAIRGLQSALDGAAFALQRGWTGQAASASNGAREAFSADFAQVLTVLQAMREKLVSAADGR